MRSLEEATTIFLGLSRLKGVGFKTLRDFGGVDTLANEFSSNPHELLEKITRTKHPKGYESYVPQLGEDAYKKIKDFGIGLVRINDDLYPSRFLDLNANSRPLWFFYRGNADLLKLDSIAVVGTRSPSDVGRFLAQYAVSAVKELNCPVVSGLAKGIDEIAHEWALQCKLPNISILGNGLLRTYPPSNADLADRIVNSGGILISEYLPTAQPSAENFVWRNRLQATLAKCVIAPEWKRSSGTAHTIRFARSLERTTINLQMAGLPLMDDHGEADLLFDVPKKHTALMEILTKKIDIATWVESDTPDGIRNHVPVQGALF